MLRLGVLASGRGSNFAAILDAIADRRIRASVSILISDRKDAPAIAIARDHGVPAHHVPFPRNGRARFEAEAARLLEEAECDLILLAGFMRILSSAFIGRFPDRILNIHPSLLPAFKGLDAQAQALAAGVTESGCTVHLVTPDLDAGPILGQRRVPVMPDDSVESLSARILAQEHQLYPAVVADYGRQILAPSPLRT